MAKTGVHRFTVTCYCVVLRSKGQTASQCSDPRYATV